MGVIFLITLITLWTKLLAWECPLLTVPFFWISFSDSTTGRRSWCVFSFVSAAFLTFPSYFLLPLQETISKGNHTHFYYLSLFRKQCFSEASVPSPTLFQELVLCSRASILELELSSFSAGKGVCVLPNSSEPLFFHGVFYTSSIPVLSTCKLAAAGSLMEISVFLNLRVIWRPWYCLLVSLNRGSSVVLLTLPVVFMSREGEKLNGKIQN